MGQKKIFATLFVVLAIACSNPAEKTKKVDTNSENVEEKQLSDAQKLVAGIEQIHRKHVFESFDAVQFDLNLTFGGKERFDGRISMRTNGSAIKTENNNSIKLWNGTKAMVLPDTLNNESARFGLLTWAYFFAAPYKLNDPGTKHEFLGQLQLGESELEANKLTFNKGIGDTPNDWYIVYKDENSDLLAAMAYIVTSGETDLEEAEKDPHVITYEAYVEVGGVPFATQWNFWTWNQEGEMDKLLGNATVSNIEFIKKAGDLFNLTASLDYPDLVED